MKLCGQLVSACWEQLLQHMVAELELVLQACSSRDLMYSELHSMFATLKELSCVLEFVRRQCWFELVCVCVFFFFG